MESTPRIPPHNNDAEISVLGSVLLDSDALIQLSDSVSAEMFYREGHVIARLERLGNIPMRLRDA